MYCPDGSIAVTDLEKASALSEQYSSVFTTDNNTRPQCQNRVPAGTTFRNIAISSESVRKVLCKLTEKYEHDPDGIPSAVLHALSYELAKPLAAMFNRFLASGFVPASWKNAFITPIFKKGAASVPGNYRPVSVTSAVCRVFERILVDHLRFYLESNDLISKHQFGFMRRRSTDLHLLTCVNDWTKAYDRNMSTGAVFIDYAKAFDTVCHSKLLHKLEYCYGIAGNVLQWIKTFLLDRTQSVKVGAAFSSCRPVLSGVPQGTVFGPVLFLLYINDLADNIKPPVSIKKFADDVTLYLSFSDSSERPVMQTSLEDACNWSEEWQLSVQPTKCAVLTIGKSEHAEYQIAESTIACVDVAADLGVLVDSKLTFVEHISSVIRKANYSLCVLFKCFLTDDRHALLRGYVSYVHPVLEYACTVWSPSLHSRSSVRCLTSVDKLESVQRSFTRRLFRRCRLPEQSYTDRLRLLKLEPLELRRLKIRLCMVYKIVHGLVHINWREFFECATESTRGHSCKLRYPYFATDVRHNCFCVSIIPIWNSLPEMAVSSVNLSCFKRYLSKCDDLLLNHCKFDRNNRTK